MNAAMQLPCRIKSAAVAALLLLGLTAPAAFAHRIEKRFTVGVRPVVAVRNRSGKIIVKSWQKNEVLVVATHASEKTEVDAEQGGNRVDIVTHLLSEDAGPADLQADFEITVPEEAELQIRNDSGDVFVEHVSGDMTFDTVAADVDLQEVAGYLVIKTISGSLVCKSCAGRIEVNSISGSFRLVQPISNNVRAKTYSGSIFFDGAFLPGGTYVMHSSSGLIEVRFSESDSFQLNAASMYGKVENEAVLKQPSHNTQTAGPSKFKSTFFGNLNQGDARVELSSFNGTIKIRKR